MSRLEQLINDLCPHGVEYKELGDNFAFLLSFSPSKGRTLADTHTGGKIPLLRRGGMEHKRHDGVVVSKSKVEEYEAGGADRAKTTPPLSAAPLRRRGISESVTGASLQQGNKYGGLNE